MSWLLAGKPVRSILVTRLRYLGDVVMSTVVLEVLRRGDPYLKIGYLAEEGHATVLSGHPDLDRVHVLSSRRRGRDAAARAVPGRDGSGSQTPLPPLTGPGMVRQLHAQGYDLAVDLFFNPRSAWLLRLAGIPTRIGGTTGSRRHLYSHTVLRRQVAADCPTFNDIAPGGLGEHLCRLAPLVHGPTGLDFCQWFSRQFQPGQLRPRLGAFPLGPAPREELLRLGVDPEQDYVVASPGATWPTKEWPLARWQSFLHGWLKRRPEPILMLTPPGPGRDWSELGAVLSQGKGGVLPPLSLPDALGLITGSRLLVSADGGIMHAGVGLGRPTLGLFGPTRVDAWFPYTEAGPFRVLATRPSCHPCNLHECPDFICLPDLEPDLVLASALELIDQPPEPDGVQAGLR